TPGVDVRLIFGRVRDDVLASTKRKQEPFVYGSLGGSDVALVPAPAAPPADPAAEARRDYELAERVGTLGAGDLVIGQYPAGFYANMARAQRAKLLDAAARQDGDRKRQEGERALAEAERQRLEREKVERQKAERERAEREGRARAEEAERQARAVDAE